MKLIVGLGNPGRGYANSRHNIGFKCVEYFAQQKRISFGRRKGDAQMGMGDVEGNGIIVAKPRTFMNLSGKAVGRLMGSYQVAIGDLVVVYDDLDLPLGSLRIRERGRSGGHNGIKSIISCLGREDFPRIRVGIAPLTEESPAQTKTPEYVLSNFTGEEKKIVKQTYPRVAAAIECLITEGIGAAMNKFN